VRLRLLDHRQPGRREPLAARLVGGLAAVVDQPLDLLGQRRHRRLAVAGDGEVDLLEAPEVLGCTACRCSTLSCEPPRRGKSNQSPSRLRAARVKSQTGNASMEKLIITVACDSRTSYPHNPLCPVQEDIPGVAQQY